MTERTIICPKCGNDISKALSEEIKGSLRVEFEQEYQIKEQNFQQQMISLKTDRVKLDQEKKSFDNIVEQKLQAEKIKLWQIAQQKATEKLGVEIKDFQEQIKEKDVKLKEAQEAELIIRKEKRELEEQRKNFALELERRLDKEREFIAQKAKQDGLRESNNLVLQKDKQIGMLRKALADLKQKSEQGSIQIQGEAQEEDLKQLLQNNFLSDSIEDVPTGIKGADLIQIIRTEFGQRQGVILWESKNTKNWSDNWLNKLKQDQGIAKADIAILVSKTLPEGIESFVYIKGVWIASHVFVLPLANILRIHLIEISGVKKSLEGRGEKIEQLYNYISGSQFKNRIENMVLGFISMKEDLETEKRVIQKNWSKREKEIEKVSSNTVGVYGDLQGIVGASLPQIKSLELPALEAGESKTQGKIF